MRSIELDVDTSRTRIVDLTRELERFCADLGDGLVSVFVPHATAGLALMETGSGSEADLLAALDLVTSTPTARRDTELTTCCPLWSAHQRPFRYWGGG
jgi:thiamine phosphate synthase YjbQ (UPF0047 family)